MMKKVPFSLLSIFIIMALCSMSLAAKVPAPQKGADGFKVVTLEETKKLHTSGATMIACHSHTTDFMRPPCGNGSYYLFGS